MFLISNPVTENFNFKTKLLKLTAGKLIVSCYVCELRNSMAANNNVGKVGFFLICVPLCKECY